MNFTPGDRNVTVAVKNRDTIEMTVVKNVTVIVLGITINYINATMVHTFNKHHVCKLLFLHRKKKKVYWLIQFNSSIINTIWEIFKNQEM